MQVSLQSTPAGYRLQHPGPEHAALLLRLYVAQREHEMHAFGWEAEQCRLFLEQQWRARNTSYAAYYPDAVDQLIVSAELPVGRLLTAQSAHILRLVDIALLPERQSRGLGTQVVQDLQRACASKGRTIVLHVARDNPARRLYARLGFAVAGQDEIYLRMEWSPR
jgi:ribosomal protein S18 acetylase RimI-like enzyme